MAYIYFDKGNLSLSQSDALKASFRIATSLSPPESLAKLLPSAVMAIQVMVSIFFLVIVIAIMAATGYTRKQLAPDVWDNDKRNDDH